SLGEKMTSIFCPYCRQHTALSIASGSYIDSYSYEGSEEELEDWKEGSNYSRYRDERGQIWWIGICNNCHECVLVKQIGSVIKIVPTPLPKPTDPLTPDFIKEDLEEAKQCLAGNSYRAASLMSRRVLQSICMDHSASGNNLMDQIDDL